MNESVSRRRIDRLHDLANFVNVDLVRKLRPENNSRLWIFAPDRARRFYSGKLRHLNVENADLGFILERHRHCLFSVGRFQHRLMRWKIALKYLAQVSALGHIVFGDQD